MNKKTRLYLGIGALLFGAVTLSGCTSSFCSTNDQAHILYAVDSGATLYLSKSEADDKLVEINKKRDEQQKSPVEFDDVFFSMKTYIKSSEEIYSYTAIENSDSLVSILKKCVSEGVYSPGEELLPYLKAFDTEVIKTSIELFKDKGDSSYVFANAKDFYNKVVEPFGYVRFADFEFGNDGTVIKDNNSRLMNNTSYYDSLARKDLTPDVCPGFDMKNLYSQGVLAVTSSTRTCFSIYSGYYGPTKEIDGVTRGTYYIEGKTWGQAWQEGFFEGLLIFPIGALVDVLWNGFNGLGLSLGWCSILAIFITTIVVRSLILLVSFKQTSSNAKMTELQPQIAKIQNKYPNSKTNNYEKQRMAEEMQALYKKNKINPFSTIIVLIVQFPVFICVWNAMQSSAALSTGSFAGLSLTATISQTLFNGEMWVANASGFIPGLTALLLFIIMAVAQTISMLLPQWLQKRKTKNVARLQKNPSANSQGNTMKWFTYIMLAMIIIMGFSLASAMGVYWLVGAIFSIAQTLITQAITAKKAKRNK